MKRINLNYHLPDRLFPLLLFDFRGYIIPILLCPQPIIVYKSFVAIKINNLRGHNPLFLLLGNMSQQTSLDCWGWGCMEGTGALTRHTYSIRITAHKQITWLRSHTQRLIHAYKFTWLNFFFCKYLQHVVPRPGSHEAIQRSSGHTTGYNVR